jgi:hypothetical protein
MWCLQLACGGRPDELPRTIVLDRGQGFFNGKPAAFTCFDWRDVALILHEEEHRSDNLAGGCRERVFSDHADGRGVYTGFLLDFPASARLFRLAILDVTLRKNPVMRSWASPHQQDLGPPVTDPHGNSAGVRPRRHQWYFSRT